MNFTTSRSTAFRFTAIALAIVLVWSCYPQTNPAWAITQETEATLTETQRQIEESAAAYDNSVATLEDLEAEEAELEARIASLEEELPTQQAKSDDATVSLYKLRQESYSLISMILDAGSLEEFLSSFEYVARIQETNLNQINRLNTLRSELETSRSELESRQTTAEQQKTSAETTLAAAQEARVAAQAKAAEEIAAEEAAAAAAVAAAQAKEAEERQRQETERATAAEAAAAAETRETVVASAPIPNEPVVNTPDAVDWSSDKTTFVNEWAGRIDAYLSGSPLAGQGATFAAAAWDNGVDPRYSPAISNTESSKGLYCFRPHNAWGWGGSSWGSWEEAINAHVRGLARGYGYTITVESARKYCPPNWEHWYTSTLNQMNMI